MSDEKKIENRREFLKKMSKWSKVALGTAVGVASLGSASCFFYGDYYDYIDGVYCNGWGMDYYSYNSYCNYSNYVDWA